MQDADVCNLVVICLNLKVHVKDKSLQYDLLCVFAVFWCLGQKAVYNAECF